MSEGIFNEKSALDFSRAFTQDFKAYADAYGITLPTPSIVHYELINSTNDEAKKLVYAGKTGFLVVADGQTAGRGRMGRSFYSPTHTGAYFSLSLSVDEGIKSGINLTSLAAVAVCRAIERLTDLSPMIKWVNDVYLNGKKVCGILTEGVISPKGELMGTVVGIGINLTTCDFPEELNMAGSLGKAKVSRTQIIAGVVAEILKEMPHISQKRYIDYYRSHSLASGREVQFFIGERAESGRAVGVDDSFGLIVELENGERVTLSSGEITLRVK